MKKFLITATLFGMNAVAAFSQGNIKKGLDQATSEVKGFFETTVNLLYAVCAIMAVVGIFNVYNKWTSGDPDVVKSAAGWIGGLVFIGVAIVIIRAVFI